MIMQLLLSDSSMITSPATIVKMTVCIKYNTVDCYLILSAPMHHLTGYCSLDGLEKVTRSICALPKSRVIAGQDTETKMLNIIQCCPETPVLGGKSEVPSKFCSSHSHLHEDTTDILAVRTPPELEYIKTKAADEIALPDSDDDSMLTACRKPTNVHCFYDRTGGIMAHVRPCGIIVNFAEMYTCESPTQCYVLLYTAIGRTLDDETE